jgi:hypothetical protein
MPEQEELRELEPKLKDKSASVREAAVAALKKIATPQAVKLLIMALEDKSAEIRKSALYALAEIGDKHFINKAKALLKDRNEKVRAAAVYALGKIGRSDAMKEIKSGLKDESISVRLSAISVLRFMIRNNEAIEALLEMLKKEEVSTVRRVAIDTLRKIGGIDAVVETYGPWQERMDGYKLNLSKEQSNQCWNQLTNLVDEWDPFGIKGDPTSEAEDFLPGGHKELTSWLFVLLERNASAHQISTCLCDVMPSLNNRRDINDFVQNVKHWFLQSWEI